MNKSIIFFCVIGFLAIQNVESKSAQAPAAQNVQEGDVTKKAQDLVKKADEFLTGNLPTSSQIITNVEETGQKFISHIKEFNEQIKKGITDNRGDIDKVLKQISDNLHAASEKIQKDVIGPDSQKKVSEIKEQLNQQFKSAAANVDKLVETIKPEADKLKQDLLSAANLFLEKAEKVADDLKKKVGEAKAKN